MSDADPSAIAISRLPAAVTPELLELHSDENGAGWCRCVAWHVPTWDGWGARTAEENLAVRRELAARGERDLWLLRLGGRPAASCQAGPRDRLPKLVEAFGLEPSPRTWAITCFLVSPSHRRRGLASRLLAGVLEDLRALGVRRVEAYPKTGGEHAGGDLAGGDLEDGEAWTGPERLYAAAGFRLVQAGRPRSVVALELAPPAGPVAGGSQPAGRP